MAIIWRLSFDTNIVAVAKVLLQVGKQVIVDRLKAGTLKVHEEIVMLTKDYPSNCPYDPETLPEVSLTEFEVELPVISPPPSVSGDFLQITTLSGDGVKPVKVFISYAWEREIKELAKRIGTLLRAEGIDAQLDDWVLKPGSQLTQFMETMVRECDYVLILCTPKYQGRSNSRTGGVGYEGHIITAEVFQKANHEKFIPLLCNGSVGTSMPTWLSGSLYIDVSREEVFQAGFDRLLATLTGAIEKAPELGKRKK